MSSIKISIIIAVYNGERFLKQTISSILNQTYKNLELIIVDGKSSDGTLEIIKGFDSKKIKWISENDKGISDAFNKGLDLATGDYINFQGDGDGFKNNFVLEKLFSGIKLENKPLICGNIERVDINGNFIFQTDLKNKFNKKSLLFKMSLPHQGLFTPKEFFNTFGKFDGKNKYCMDYDILLRAYHNFPPVICDKITVSYWRADGLGEGRTIEILKEYNKIKIKNKVSNRVYLFLIHLFSISKFYVKTIFKL